MDDLVAIAKIVKPRGLKGELVAELLTDFPERFEELERVTAIRDGESIDLKIEEHWFQKDRIILRFAEVDSIEKAERLRGAEICVPEAEAVPLERDEYFDWQLAGCRVETIGGNQIGTVRELMRTGGTELLVVEGERDYLIPFAESICVHVDVDNKLIQIDPPEGLLEF